MKINCTFCGAGYDVDPEYIGKKLNCSSCSRDFEVKNPNLQPCPDCFSMISKRAAACPHCGAPLLERSCGKTNEPHPMPNTAQEKDILICHPGAMNYFWTIFFGIITSFLLVGIFILIYVWIEISCTTYRITNLRIIIQRGLIAKMQTEIWIKDMRGANLVQNVWQRIVNVGDISIGTAATAGNEINLIGIGNPQKVVDTINSLRQ